MDKKTKHFLTVVLLTVVCLVCQRLWILIKVEEQTYILPSSNTESIHKRNYTHEIHFHRKDTSPEKTGALQFLKNFKNPCWKEATGHGKSMRIQCLPYFYIVGSPRCGTTDLNSRLIMHPSISKRVSKENHWIARKRFYRKGKSNTLSQYLRLFDRAVQTDITTKQRNGYYYSIFGDSSCSNLWDNVVLLREWKKTGMTEKPYYTNANVIYNLTHTAKIIMLLRNPVTRLYSDYLAFTRRRVNAADFHEKVVFSVDHYKYCLKKHDERYCAYYYPNTGVRLTIGLYIIYIEDYLRVFPRNQIKILKTENYSENISSSLKDVFNFLEIGIPTESIMNSITGKGKINGNRRRQIESGKMLPKTHTLLSNFYQPYNEKLVKLLGDRFIF
ncbi:carbohydrate sulfotransferase 15-like [Mercenaria mercenaria]|uniref:carbohydrate sulfotransferase 15-like n=1 Tax=Mercenaria mercenaria TaxID=6596 RepID=UPI00234EA4AB|nr:carbohydrate sulfotransferase 15-like [Mercenaria mercenaria]